MEVARIHSVHYFCQEIPKDEVGDDRMCDNCHVKPANYIADGFCLLVCGGGDIRCYVCDTCSEKKFNERLKEWKNKQVQVVYE